MKCDILNPYMDLNVGFPDKILNRSGNTKEWIVVFLKKGGDNMTIRERVEQMEAQRFSPYASLSQNSKGRERPEEECDIRPCYQRDRDRILHSKSFRRMKQKTQVFVCPYGDHYRTRLTHTLEVAQTARTIAQSIMFE